MHLHSIKADNLAARMMKPNLSREKVIQLVRYFREKPADNTEINEFAKNLEVTATRLIRCFVKYTGVTPNRYRLALRAVEAKRLLLHSEMPVTEISMEVGYNSLGTFISTFKSLVGIAPSAFRRLSKRLSIEDLVHLHFAPKGTPQAARWVDGREDATIHFSGFVPYSESKDASLVAVGLFMHPVPHGPPLCGTVCVDGGRIELFQEFTGQRVYLLAVRFLPPLSTQAIWLPSRDQYLVHRSCLFRSALAEPGNEDYEILFRTPNELDPPIVLAVPAFLRNINI